MKRLKRSKSNNVRQRNILPLIIVVVGFILGAVLIGIGVYNSFNAEYDKFEALTEEGAKKIVDEKSDEVKKLRTERDEEYNRSAYSEKYEELSNQIIIAEGELSDAESTYFQVRNGFYEDLKNDKIWSSVPFILAGVLSIVVAIGVAMNVSSNKKKNVILTITEENE